MAQNAPGKYYREGITLVELFRMFPDDETAQKWFEKQIWKNGRYCPRCGSTKTIECNKTAKHPLPYRCHDCNRHFSVKMGTVMERSKIGFQKWAIAIYLHLTSLKGVSSMKLHRDLGIRQATAWFMLQRIRETWKLEDLPEFSGPVEADETYMGGKEKNKHNKKKLKAGRGPVGKTAVAGMKDRKAGKVKAKTVKDTRAKTLQGFVETNTVKGAKVYTDDAAAYLGLDREHESVKHSVGEYVRDMAHTNGIESFWSMLKRGYQGTFHHFSEKHMDRYIVYRGVCWTP